MPGSPPGESVDLLDRSAASLRCASQCGDAAERGASICGAREADDLLRQAEVFLGIVADVLGAPRRDAVAAYLIPIGVGAAGGGRG